MAEFLFAATGFIFLMVTLSLARIFLGPVEADRLMAAQLLGSSGVAMLLLLAVATKTFAVVDVALLLALLAAFASVAFVNNAAESQAATKDAANRS